jgi:hypothetical protein
VLFLPMLFQSLCESGQDIIGMPADSIRKRYDVEESIVYTN